MIFPTITTIFFDFGGVLVRTQSRATRHRWDTRLGKPLGTGEKLLLGSKSSALAQSGTISEAEHMEWVRKQLGLTPFGLDLFYRDFFADDALNWDVCRFLPTLQSNANLAILSNFFPSLRGWLGEIGLEKYFNQLFVSAEMGVAKPDPQIFLLAAEKMQVAPQACLFIDDVESNVNGAQTCGMHAIHYTPNTDLRTELEQLLGFTLSV